MYVISTAVITQPDDINICEGKGAVFTCVLVCNATNYDVQWYRFIKSNSTTVMVDRHGESINFINITTGNTIKTSLNITNAKTSYNGYFKLEPSPFNVCNASLSVGTSTYLNRAAIVLAKQIST